MFSNGIPHRCSKCSNPNGFSRKVSPPAESTETTFELARLADCAAPSCPHSVGADFLRLVSICTLEAYDPVADASDLAHEIADGCVPVYTHERWRVFCDLAAYQEDLSDFGTPHDLTEAAGFALYQIAYRLAHAILER